MIGYQSIWDSGFTFDTGIGVQMVKINSIEVDVKSAAGVERAYESGSVSGTIPIIQLAVGYAF